MTLSFSSKLQQRGLTMDLATFQEMVKNSSFNEEWVEFRVVVNGYYTADGKTSCGEYVSVNYSDKNGWWVDRVSIDHYPCTLQYGAGKTLEQAIFNFNS